MPDPGCGPTLADRLNNAVGWVSRAETVLRWQGDALEERPGFDLQARNREARIAIISALAELRSLERAVAERPDVAGQRLSHGETP